MRNVMITTIGEDYVLAAQAKGLSNRRVMFTYAARNALLPQLQGFGLALGFVVSGAIVMEIVFSYPGIGLLLLNAVTSNDFPLMQAIFLVITFAVLLANLIVDLVIVAVDPRARATGGRPVTVALPVSTDPAAPCRRRRAAGPVAAAAAQGQGGRGPARAVFVLAAIIGPLVTPYDPSFQNPAFSLSLHGARRRAPARHHPERPGRAVAAAGRDPAHARAGAAAWASIATALSVIVGVSGGVPRRRVGRGAVAGHQRVPGHPGAAAADRPARLPAADRARPATILVLSGLGWPWGARVIRAQTLAIRGRDFVAAARETGERTWRIIAFEIVPERGQPDRGELREHGALRDRGLGRARLHRPVRPVHLEPRHDALLGPEPAGAAARARGGGSCRPAWPWR